MDFIILKSPAKINLGLNVLRKRNDGYHDLETIFYPLLLTDIIKFVKSSYNSFSSNSDALNQKEDNLILRAKRQLEEKVNRKLTTEITLEKKIPIGGGLGGGSSNAATTLIAFNKLFNLKISFFELSELALQLGSDVPFFLNPVPCFAESRGEKLIPIPFQLTYPILIVNPGINISTSSSFSKINPAVPAVRLNTLFSNSSIDLELMKEKVKNDFEEIIFKEYPVVGQIKTKLYELGAEFALMTGTGSSVFGIFNNLQKASFAEDDFKQKYFTYLNNPFQAGSIT